MLNLERYMNCQKPHMPSSTLLQSQTDFFGSTVVEDYLATVNTLLEKAMAPHSSTLAWKIPWTEEPGGPQSTGLLRVRQDSATSLSCIGEGNGNPLQCSCLKNPRDGGAWWAAVYGVAQSWTRLKRLSSSNTLLVRTLKIYLPRVWPVMWING